MGYKIASTLLLAWAKIHALLPMNVLYLFSDILYVLIYYVVRYRRRVVKANLKGSFPKKSKKELRQLERRFYHHFADYIVETIKLAGISEQEVLRRAHINNPELIQTLQDKGHSCFILLMGHYGNWEWFSGSMGHFGGRVQLYQVYRPLTNKAFDQLFIYLRTKFGAAGIKKREVAKDIIRLKQEKNGNLVIFIADQTPSKANLHYWTHFLNRESAIITGPERLARKLHIPVIYNDVKRIKRGYYTVDFHLITERPHETPEFYITEHYARLMEASIMRDPAFWLWTHKRWKHTPQLSHTGL